MSSNKQGKVSSLFNYYEETELDNLDEQPIDFSKRYSDLESDHVSKSLGKKRHISTTSVISEPTSCKQQCEDDLRVYCIEGTPLLTSSSSSICDLRYVGASESVESTKKPVEVVTDSQSSCCPEPNMETLKNPNLEKIEETSLVEVDANCESKEDGNTQIIEVDENISKISSPLMFSRSSSVCSLNSFGQNSIIDDRSSVSILSNLTSGIISPSEIPDSPGEAMLSPFISKNKQTEFKFPTCENEKDPNLVTTNTDISFNPTVTPGYEDSPFDDIKIYNIEGDCSSMSSFSELSIHTSSNMSVACHHNLKDIVNVDEKQSLKISCTANIDVCSFEDSKTGFPSDAQNVPLREVSPVNLNSEESLQSSPKLFQCDESFPNDKSELFEIGQNITREETDIMKEKIIISSKNISEENHSQIKEVDVVDTFNSLSESEDESDSLLEECIRNGRPSKNSALSEVQTTAKKYSQTQNLRNLQKSNLTACDDENDLLIKQCIDLGRPQKSCRSEKSKKTSNVPDPQSRKFQKFKLKNVQTNCKFKPGHITEDCQMEASNSDAILQGRKYCSQQTAQKHIEMKPFRPHLNIKATDPVKNLRKEILMGVFNTMNERKTEKNVKSVPSDSDDDEQLLNQCIKLGMPDNKKNKIQKQSHNLPSRLSLGHSQSSVAQAQLEPKSVQNISPSKTSSVFSQARKDHVLLQSRATQVKTSHKNRHCQVSSHNQLTSKKHQSSSQSKCGYSYQVNEGNRKYLEASKKEKHCKLEKNSTRDESNILLQQCIQLGMPTKSVSKNTKERDLKNNFHLPNVSDVRGYRDNRPDGASDVEDDNDDDILLKCINAGKPKPRLENKYSKTQCSSSSKSNFNSKLNRVTPQQLPVNVDKKGHEDKIKQELPSVSSKKVWPPSFFIPYEDSMTEESLCVYKTEDTPVLSPTASISDLSTLSFNEDKNFPLSYLNNSRNSDCSSDSDDDDELLLECIRAGMPAAKRALA